MLLGGRILAALCHGAFFGIGSVVAAALVPAHKKAGAIAMMFAGLTIANVLGVPLGTLLGQQFGWRSTFWAITAIGLVALVGIVALCPRMRPEGAGLRRELSAFGHPQVWLSLADHRARLRWHVRGVHLHRLHAHRVSGFASATVPWLLVLFGLGLFVGNYSAAGSPTARCRRPWPWCWARWSWCSRSSR